MPDSREKESPEKKHLKSDESQIITPAGTTMTPAPGLEAKRSLPTPVEKVSPEKKHVRVSEDGPSPRALFFEESQPLESQFLPQVNTAEQETSDQEKAEKPVSKTPVPAPEMTVEQKMLMEAMEKIKQLEQKLTDSVAEKAKVVAPVATPQNKVVKTSTPTSALSKTTTTTSDAEPGEDDDKPEPEGVDLMTFPNGARVMSQDALRMRLRRMCEVKAKTGRCNVDPETRSMYERGGEDREWLEIALLEAISKVGADCRKHKALRVPWQIKFTNRPPHVYSSIHKKSKGSNIAHQFETQMPGTIINWIWYIWKFPI